MDNNENKKQNYKAPNKKKKTIIISSIVSGLVIVGTVLGVVFGVKACSSKDLTREEFLTLYASRSKIKEDTTATPYTKVTANGNMKEGDSEEKFDNKEFTIKLSVDPVYASYRSVLFANDQQGIDMYLALASTKVVLENIIGIYVKFDEKIVESYKSIGSDLTMELSGKSSNTDFKMNAKYNNEGFLTNYSYSYGENYHGEITFSNYKK